MLCEAASVVVRLPLLVLCFVSARANRINHLINELQMREGFFLHSGVVKIIGGGSDPSAYLSLRCRLLRCAGSGSRGWLSLQACPILSIQPLMPQSRPEETLQPADQLRGDQGPFPPRAHCFPSLSLGKNSVTLTHDKTVQNILHTLLHYFKLLYTQQSFQS